jgi:G:T/U-mismatch repair DNA glycosylase
VQLAGFAPLVDARAETLILGSFPGDASLWAARANDFAGLLEPLPRLRRVLFNAQSAARFALVSAVAG